MKKIIYTLFLIAVFATKAKAQKIESIYFNLYTDSLKKGVYNYINVDGNLSNGSFAPLDAKQLIFSSSYGKWDGNSLIIDSSYSKDSVVVTIVCRENASILKSTTIYMKKNLVPEKLKTEEEIIDGFSKPKKKRN
ncbi:MAG: hypothetical protein H7178_09980 [Chitinophagaceae bacterium]|nr:hypothetical protein [Chitinophagaceae bacterium]